MADPIVTLTTDFGTASPYVAAMKGAILTVNPRARLIDLSHEIPPQDLRHTAFFLAAALPHFPGECIHVIVVDPGVGTARPLLYIELGKLRLLVPDNGCWTELAKAVHARPVVVRLAEPSFWRETVSATFHGRDILGPVAGHLSLGIDPNRLGPPVKNWIRLEIPSPRLEGKQLWGEVVFIDDFGNLITNIPADVLRSLPGPLRIQVGEHPIERQVRTYGEAPSGAAVALVSSTERLEIGVSQGNAAKQLLALVGAPVTITFRE